VQVWVSSSVRSFVLFAGVAVLLIAPWINLQFRRFGRFRGWPAVVSTAIVLYGCALIAFTMLPLPGTVAGFCAKHAGRTYWQLTPLASLDDVLLHAQDHSLVQTLVSGVLLQVLMNVVFFVPLGFLLLYRWRRTWWQAILAALALSLAIELTQGTGLWGLAQCPYRLADVDDLLTNTVGGLLGWLLAFWLGRYLPDPLPPREPDLESPGIPRRVVALLLDSLVYLLAMLLLLVLLHRTSGDPDTGTAGFADVSIGVTAACFLLFPLLRRRRSTPGAVAVRVQPMRHDGRPPGPWNVVRLYAIRWLPVVAFGLAAVAVVLIADVITAALRADRRTMSELVGGVRTVTIELRDLESRGAVSDEARD
jgi:glycopeptide antibiotics resistance protein